MTNYDRIAQTLSTADVGLLMRNKDNDREVEVTKSRSLRYLCRECGKMVCCLRDETAAYQFLKGEIL